MPVTAVKILKRHVNIIHIQDDILFIICPIAITYSTGQIIKPVCGYASVHLCALSRSHFLINFHQNWHPKEKIGFIGGQLRTTLAPILGPEIQKIHANIKNHISALNVCKSPKFLPLLGNHGGGTRW